MVEPRRLWHVDERNEAVAYAIAFSNASGRSAGARVLAQRDA
jgi:hypothetical protein